GGADIAGFYCGATGDAGEKLALQAVRDQDARGHRQGAGGAVDRGDGRVVGRRHGGFAVNLRSIVRGLGQPGEGFSFHIRDSNAVLIPLISRQHDVWTGVIRGGKGEGRFAAEVGRDIRDLNRRVDNGRCRNDLEVAGQVGNRGRGPARVAIVVRRDGDAHAHEVGPCARKRGGAAAAKTAGIRRVKIDVIRPSDPVKAIETTEYAVGARDPHPSVRILWSRRGANLHPVG